MNALIVKVADPDFVVLATPCNQFNLQEPGLNSELLNGIKHVRPGGGYEPMFNLTAKLDVNGDTEHELYTFLKAACPQPQSTIVANKDIIFWNPIKQSDITWNFEKFLIDQSGQPVKRYVPAVNPLHIYNDVMELLNAETKAKDAVADENEASSHQKEAGPHLDKVIGGLKNGRR